MTSSLVLMGSSADPSRIVQSADLSNGANGAMPSDVPTIEVIPPLVHIVRFAKNAGRALDESKLEQQLRVIMESASTSQRAARGWTIEFDSPTAHNRFVQ